MTETEKNTLTDSEKRNVERCVNLLSILMGGNVLVLVVYVVCFVESFFSDMSASSFYSILGCSFCSCVISFMSMIYAFRVMKTARHFVSF